MTSPLCDRTVTIYRREAGVVSRRVAAGCFYRWEDSRQEDGGGLAFHRKFLLIQPGAEEIRPGDRVYDGIGPELVDWEQFLPENVPGLSVVANAGPRYFDGKLVHYQASN